MSAGTGANKFKFDPHHSGNQNLTIGRKITVALLHMESNQEGERMEYKPRYGVRVADEYKGLPTPLLPPRAVYRGWIQDTSAHGVAHIFNSRGESIQLFAIILVMSTLIGLSFQTKSPKYVSDANTGSMQ